MESVDSKEEELMKVKIENAKVLANSLIAKDVYKMILETSIAEEIKVGQFINIKIRDHFLRRPISVASIDGQRLTIVYKSVGRGTEELSTYKAGEGLEIMGPLGRFFSLHEELDQVLIVGGGLGVPPLFELAKQYLDLGKKVKVVLGFRSAEDVFFESDFRELGAEVYVATDDGSYGFKGNVLELVAKEGIDIDFVYAVGPKPMLRAIQEKYSKGYISLEERMACGVGLCMGCVCKDKNIEGKSYRVCKEGPVFEIGKVII